MTDFTRTKMHFALALIGTLFALHPILEKFPDLGFTYLDYPLPLFDVYMAIAGLLAFTVYCYAVALLSERATSRWERLGNFTYALGILVLPLYGSLYVSSRLAEEFGLAHLAVTAPAVTAGLGVLWVLFAWWLRHRLGLQDQHAKIAQLAKQEMDALYRGPEMLAAHHYDLAVIEAWKAIEARLRRELLTRGYKQSFSAAHRLIEKAVSAGILTETAKKQLDDLRKQWNVAVSTEPLSREAAEAAVASTRHVLATIPRAPHHSEKHAA